jgi:spore coat protein U-like protein
MAELLKPLIGKETKMNLGYKKKLLGVIALLGMFSAMEANAQQSQNMSVNATVPQVCVIDAGQALAINFGDVLDIDGANTFPEVSETVNWRCSNGNSATLVIDAGLAAGATDTTRAMVGPSGPATETLAYSLYQPDASGTAASAVNWGSTNATGVAITGAGMGSTQSTTIFGAVTGDATGLPAGSYSDTVVITVNP